MKKYVSVIVAAALLGAAWLQSYTVQSNQITAGAGNHQNEEVKNPNAMYSVLNYAAERNGSTSRVASNPFLYAASTSDSSLDIKQHTSATMVENTVIDIFTNHYSVSGYDSLTGNAHYNYQGSTSSSFSRSLTVYMTETASYYVSKGYASVSHEDENTADGKDASYETFIAFDLQVYQDETTSLVKFSKFMMTENSEDEEINHSILPEYKELWIEITAESLSRLFQAIDSFNRDGLLSLMDYIEKSVESDDYSFKKKGDTYTLTDKIKEGTETIQKTEISFDFKDQTSPYIELLIKGENSLSDSSYRTPNSTYMHDTLVFSNIDNTVIENNVVPDYVCDSLEEFGELFTE